MQCDALVGTGEQINIFSRLLVDGAVLADEEPVQRGWCVESGSLVPDGPQVVAMALHIWQDDGGGPMRELVKRMLAGGGALLVA